MPLPKILYTTPILRYPAIGGPELRVLNSIRALSEVSQLHLISQRPLSSIGDEVAYNYFSDTSEFIEFTPSCDSNRTPTKRTLPQRLRRKLSALFQMTNRKAHHQLEDFQYIATYAKKHRIDLIWLGYGNISYPLLHHLKRTCSTPVVVDTDSVWSRFILREIPYTTDANRRHEIEKEGHAKAVEEEVGTNLADATTAVSEIDATYYRSLTKHPDRIHIFPNTISLADYKDLPEKQNSLNLNLYLAGSFFEANCPMLDAAKWTIEEVLPILTKRIPNVVLHIVGRGSSNFQKELSHPLVTIHGEVQSVLPIIAQADVVLVPLRFESGTRFKILEAGACKKPVVSTTLGAEGLPVTNESNILLSDTPESFADSIYRVLVNTNTANSLSSNLYKLVSASFSDETLQQQAREIISFLKIN
jgi:glycosyltransferase involved in cell wall biosynthesis